MTDRNGTLWRTRVFGIRNEAIASMTSEQCHHRANQCAANAGASVDQAIAMEFLKLAAQWRAMAARTIFLGSVEAAVETPVLDALEPPLV